MPLSSLTVPSFRFYFRTDTAAIRISGSHIIRNFYGNTEALLAHWNDEARKSINENDHKDVKGNQNGQDVHSMQLLEEEKRLLHRFMDVLAEVMSLDAHAGT